MKYISKSERACGDAVQLQFWVIHVNRSLIPLVLFLCLFRYYFKKVSDEFDCGVVFEEVREDDAILPIFEEKIIGKVEKVD